MHLSEKLKTHRAEILKIIEANHTLYPRIIRDDLQGYDLDSSHLNIVVDRTSDFMPPDIGKIQQQLEELLGVTVDVITPNLLPDDQRETILAEALKI
jgi:uncharacterized protein